MPPNGENESQINQERQQAREEARQLLQALANASGEEAAKQAIDDTQSAAERTRQRSDEKIQDRKSGRDLRAIDTQPQNIDAFRTEERTRVMVQAYKANEAIKPAPGTTGRRVLDALV